MLDIFKKWYERYLFEEEAVLLLVLLAVFIVLLVTRTMVWRYFIDASFRAPS